MPERIKNTQILKSTLVWLGWIGLGALLFLVGWLLANVVVPTSGVGLLVRAVVLISAIVAMIWAVRRFGGALIWRLRNRLLITYLFIAVVPLILVAGLAAMGAYLLMLQLTINVATDELDRRVAELNGVTEALAVMPSAQRPAALERLISPMMEDRFPGLEVVMRDSGRDYWFPDQGRFERPAADWPDVDGIVARNGRYYLWSYRHTDSGDITLCAPLSQSLLDRLAPDLGAVDVAASADELRLARTEGALNPNTKSSFFLDTPLLWFATVPALDWDHPEAATGQVFLAVGTRVSAVWAAVFNRQADFGQGLLLIAMLAGLAIFLMVELACWAVGVGMTRSITGAVDRLYIGTQKVMQGDFSHRIHVSGNDQLSDLGVSFNRMTEHVEQLLAVAQEKERLQSEIEIAHEVQSLLFPRQLPSTSTLRMSAVCHPARIVSGDYYDFESIRDRQIAIAIGDVAGKGISAALLMASVQSSFRTQLQSAAKSNEMGPLSASTLVSRLNEHLFANTSAAKYATFCLGLYNDESSTFSYTNAGHLPPLLVRNGKAQKLEVNGTVVGAFSFVQYSESHLVLEPGDLLVGFTDGITEPENAFGEMFGDRRLIDLLERNAHKEDERIIEIILNEVRDWTGEGELQDDMTLLLARRV